MRFLYHHSMCPVDQYAPLTLAAERLGFDGVALPDSICYPKESTSKYPYNADGSREFLDDVPFLEPFLLAAHLSALTHKIRFTTSVMKLAIRQPVIVAKQLMSLAVLAGGRFSFGVGISPWQEDYCVSQVPWNKRGKRMDEMIEILYGLMKGNFYSYQGDIFTIPEIKLSPVPNQPVPILIGGHSSAALKRAARLGDGWVSAGGTFEDTKSMISRINQLRIRFGRDHLPFNFSVSAAEAFSLDGLKQLEDIGVDEVTLAFRNVYDKEEDSKSVEEKVDIMKWYSDEIISRF